MSKEKLTKYKNGYIKYQFQLIDALKKQIDKLNPKADKKQATVYVQLLSTIISIMYKVKAAKNLLKEVYNEDINIPDKYSTYDKLAADTVTLTDDGKLVGQEGMEIELIVEAVINQKTEENGKNDKK